ncbi:E3 ubiquitin-protein ligase RNF139-like [Gigantopelta aegis]|uniref:E3 ubiquitin-protein ligase RNF139-like n=1 Tax=Gigantopelta aegis TaxID=1735272 RepID=UPI001B88D74E|nr:E3 ubiquitin-protein ligase RNF139-like [Gigantopelta aegis]
MSWQNIAENALDVVLRVPSLFVIDCILNGNFLHFLFVHVLRTSEVSTDWASVFWMLFIGICCCIAVIVFCLDVKQLIDTYSYVLSFAVLLISQQCSFTYVIQMYSLELRKMEEKPYMKPYNFVELVSLNPYIFCSHIFYQLSLSQIFILLRTNRHSYRQSENNNGMRFLFQMAIHISLTFPLTVLAFYQDFQFFLWTPLMSLIFPMLQLISDLCNSLYNIFITLVRTYSLASETIQAVGIQSYVEGHWVRVRVPTVLRVFFVLRVLYQVASHILYMMYQHYVVTGIVDYWAWSLSTETLQLVAVRSCETTVSLLGLTSIVSLVTHYIGLFMAFCIGSDTEEDRNMGTVSAILFFILALQTGLTGLIAEKRLMQLYRNFCLLSTAILHFVYNMVNPLLMSLSASRNTNIVRHARALMMCVFLTLFPLWLLTYLWSRYTISTWLLAVTAFSIEVIFKVFICLLVYTLFIVDAYRDKFWEKLDDYVYYVQSTGNTVEFLFGIFLFCNGVWIMLFESGGAIRAIMMCIHVYFNIWMQAREGWKVFMKRRTAVNKINSLPTATQEELDELKDVCAICYQELKGGARVTRCSHYFHGICLRKWLYVQDRCPLCHKLIYNPDPPPPGAGPAPRGETPLMLNNDQAPPLVQLNQDRPEHVPDVIGMGNHVFPDPPPPPQPHFMHQGAYQRRMAP